MDRVEDRNLGYALNMYYIFCCCLLPHTSTLPVNSPANVPAMTRQLSRHREKFHGNCHGTGNKRPVTVTVPAYLRMFPVESDAGPCGHIREQAVARAKKRARNAHHSPNRIRVHWSGEARARPRDANFLRGAGGSLTELFSG